MRLEYDSVPGAKIRKFTTSNEPGQILLADFAQDHCIRLRDLLELEGYNVISAFDGREALSVMRNRSIDLALLEISIPHVSGFSVCRSLKSEPATRLIPVILVTNGYGSEIRTQAIQCGADDFFYKPFNENELLARIHSLLNLKEFTDDLDHAETVLFSLALGIEAKDRYTHGHSERLAAYCQAMAERLHLPRELQIALYRAAIVHDIGKVSVPERILLKCEPLTEMERRIIEQHPIVGEKICSPLKSFRQVLSIVRHHHERLDGTGYPDKLVGEQISLPTRILSIVDVYDALTTDRPYHAALSSRESLGILASEARKGYWDTLLVKEFASLIEDSKLGERTKKDYEAKYPNFTEGFDYRVEKICSYNQSPRLRT